MQNGGKFCNCSFPVQENSFPLSSSYCPIAQKVNINLIMGLDSYSDPAKNYRSDIQLADLIYQEALDREDISGNRFTSFKKTWLQTVSLTEEISLLHMQQTMLAVCCSPFGLPASLWRCSVTLQLTLWFSFGRKGFECIHSTLTCSPEYHSWRRLINSFHTAQILF